LTRITEWVKKSGISEEKLKKDDIELLLRVLEFDGRVEKIPFNGLMQMSEDERDGGKTRKNLAGKRKRKGDVSEEDESDVDRKRKRKKDMEESEEEEEIPKKRKATKGMMDLSEDETRSPSKSKKGKRARKFGSDSEDDWEKKRAVKGNDSESEHSDASTDDLQGFAELDAEDAFVYRAIRPIHAIGEPPGGGSSSTFLFSGSGSAWLGGGEQPLPWAEAPCVRCPQIDFCEEGGPVNASTCEYLKQWLDPDRLAVVQESKGERDVGPVVPVEIET